MFKIQKWFIFVCVCLPSMAMAIPISAGFVPVGQIKGGKGVVIQHQRVNFENSHLSPLPNPHVTVQASLIGHLIILTKDTSVGALLPYVRVKSVIEPFFNSDLKSLSDPVLLAFTRLHSAQGLGWFFSTGILGSIGIPLGEFKRTSTTAGLIPRGLQVGKGNWSQTAGLTMLYEDIDKMVAGNLSYTNHTKGNSYKHPNQLDYNLAFSYRFYPWVFKDWVEYPFEAMANLEFLGTYKWKQNPQIPLDGADIDTKGNLIKIAPGVKLEALGFQVNVQYLRRLSDSINGKPPVRFIDSWVVGIKAEFV